mmetsp:Transcript_9004/g.16885  ORF Transcript_9004/g.16885 Transcript_9004/m.16885 type:complete len:655 (+) Transcript_9004:794-2758(+)
MYTYSFDFVNAIAVVSQRPANIRIKSSTLEAVHVKLSVDLIRKQCSLVHVAEVTPPKVNGRKIKCGSAIWLGDNDVISIVGREFVLRTDFESFQPNPSTDVENVYGGVDKSDADTNTPVQKQMKNRPQRAFGCPIDENTGTFMNQTQPTKLKINTVAPNKNKIASPLHSLSSVSSLSASESEISCSPKCQSRIVMFPTNSDGDDAKGMSESQHREKSTKHVQFEGDKSSFVHEVTEGDDDDDEEVDENDFYDIIAEADRLMLNKEDEFAVQVNYNRMALEKQGSCSMSSVRAGEHTDDHLKELEKMKKSSPIDRINESMGESDDEERFVDTVELTLPSFPAETSDEEGDVVKVTSSCYIANTNIGTVTAMSSSSSEKVNESVVVDNICAPRVENSHQDTLYPANNDVDNDLVTKLSYGDDSTKNNVVECGESGIGDDLNEDNQSDDVADHQNDVVDVRNIFGIVNDQCNVNIDEGDDNTQIAGSSYDILRQETMVEPVESPPDCTAQVDQFNLENAEQSFSQSEPPHQAALSALVESPDAISSLTYSPTIYTASTSHNSHVTRIMMSLALLEPIGSSHFENQDIQRQNESDSTEQKSTSSSSMESGMVTGALSGVGSASTMLQPPPEAPWERRQQGEWCLHSFRYLSRSWRGFF